MEQVMYTQTNVLVVEDESDLREIIAFFLNSQYGVNVIEAENGLEAKAIIDSNPNIQLVISDYNMPELNGGKLFQHLKEINHPAKFVLISAINPKDAPEFEEQFPDAFAEKPAFSETLKDFMNQFLKRKDAFHGRRARYVGVSTPLLSMIGVLPCDLYAKLSDSKFVKVVNGADLFGEDESQRFFSKGIHILYVEEKMGLSLFESLKSSYLKRISKPGLEVKDQLKISNEITSSVMVMASQFGFSPELEQMTKVGVDLAVEVINKNPDLKKLLDSVNLEKGSYLSVHSTRITYLANYIAKLMDWGSESTSLKMAFASLLHDSTLNNQLNHHQMTELTLDQSKVEMTPEDLDDFIHHPIRAAKIVEQFKGLPPDVDVIIVQHHERPDGTGFPNQLNHVRIAPLACVFIVAHDILEYYEMKGADFRLIDFINESQTRYAHGVFKKILSKLHMINFN